MLPRSIKLARPQSARYLQSLRSESPIGFENPESSREGAKEYASIYHKEHKDHEGRAELIAAFSAALCVLRALCGSIRFLLCALAPLRETIHLPDVYAKQRH